MQALAQISGDVDINDDGASANVSIGDTDADASVSLGGDGGSNDGSVDADANGSVGGDNGADAGGSVSVGDDGGGNVDPDVSVGGDGVADAGGNVSVGGNTGSGGGSGGGGGGSGGGTGGNTTDGSDTDGGAGGGTGGGTSGGESPDVASGGGSMGTMMDYDDGRNVILGNGQRAAVLIGLIVYSSDGVALGVVSDIAGFDGTNMRLALVPNSSLGLSQDLVLIDVPVSRLTHSELRLSITAAEFVRVVSA